MKICVIYDLPCVSKIAGISEICNNASTEGLSHYFLKNIVTLGKRKF